VKLATIDEYLAGLSGEKRCARETPKDHPICRAKGRAWWKLFEDVGCMRDMEFCGQHHRLMAGRAVLRPGDLPTRLTAA